MDASINRNQHFMSANYAHNGKIMLSVAVILCVIILVIIVFRVYFKWRLDCRRCNIWRRQDDPEAIISTHVSPPGLDVTVLSSLPTFVYNSTTICKGCPPLECAVCLSEFEDMETGRVLPKCNHSFHVECIDMWFFSHSNCPLCRAPVQLLDTHIPASATISLDSTSEKPSSIF